MKLLLVRHAVAEEREDFRGKDDDLRPLTSKGKKDFEKVSKIYKKIYPDVEEFYSSDLLRAKQTADILTKRYNTKYKIIEELRPEENPNELLKRIQKSKGNFVAIVGHEPSLSQFIGYVITGAKKSIVEMKKGGACLLDLEERQILALHPPKTLKVE